MTVIVGVILIYFGVAVYQSSMKPLPTGLSLAGPVHPTTGPDVEFIYDLTAVKGERLIFDQRIFDRVLRVIREAQDFILADFFLFNDDLRSPLPVHRNLCRELSDALLKAKRNHPRMHVVVITDPINEFYGGSVPAHFQNLRQAGISVISTKLDQLRDSNPAYSALWRICVQWFGRAEGRILAHPFAKDRRVSIRSWLALPNFKANHRKVLVADAPRPEGDRQMICMVLSANPHGGSSAHSNVGVLMRNGIWRDLLQSEQAILSFSSGGLDLASCLPAYADQGESATRSPQTSMAGVRLVTEAKIRDQLLQVLEAAGKGDAVDLAMFYLSDRGVVRNLINAAARGATVRVLLDPNRDAFGYKKNGIPNRPVAAELMARGGGKITVRWFNTHGEQFHTKMLRVNHGDRSTLIVGSANFTRRNLADLNLETDVAWSGPNDFPAIQAAQNYFERAWANEGLGCSVPHAAHADSSRFRYWLYRFQEWSGISTF